jgi:hypothetical protein
MRPRNFESQKQENVQLSRGSTSGKKKEKLLHAGEELLLGV